jgi:hypothetical protein
MIRWLVVLVVLICAAPVVPARAQGNATATAPGAEAALKEIGDLRAGLVDAFNKRDIDKLLSYLHPDVVVTWQNSEISKGREASKPTMNA